MSPTIDPLGGQWIKVPDFRVCDWGDRLLSKGLNAKGRRRKGWDGAVKRIGRRLPEIAVFFVNNRPIRQFSAGRCTPTWASFR